MFARTRGFGLDRRQIIESLNGVRMENRLFFAGDDAPGKGQRFVTSVHRRFVSYLTTLKSALDTSVRRFMSETQLPQSLV